ncbi:MAG: GAF domain-containing protein [Fusobacteriaceae bacterium]
MNRKIIGGKTESLIYTALVYFFFFHYSKFKFDFLQMNIHPLALVTAYISLKYGVFSGLVGAALSLIFYVLAYIRGGNDPVIFLSTFSYYKFILIFFFIALILGRFSDRKRETIEDLKSDKDILKRKYEEKRVIAEELSELNERLKHRIIESKESILTLHQMTSNLMESSVEEIFTRVISIFKEFLGSKVLSIYMYNKERNVIRAKVKVGYSEFPSYIQLDGKTNFDQVLQKGEPMEFQNPQEGGSPMYIFPILRKNELLGFVNVEKLYYTHREKYSFEIFKVISQWVNKALEVAIEKKNKAIEENSYPGTRVYNFKYFNEILNEEKNRKNLFETEYLAFEGEIKDITPEILEKQLGQQIRDVDMIGLEGNLLRVLFVNTEKNNRDLLLKRLYNLFPGADFYEI